VLVLLSLIFWGWLWGAWGMILAVPITSTLKIVFENVEALQPLSVLMSGSAEKA
jgi:AI-2 transport protein TqsA